MQSIESVEALSQDRGCVLKTDRPVVAHFKQIALLEQKVNQPSQPGTGRVRPALKNSVYALKERFSRGSCAPFHSSYGILSGRKYLKNDGPLLGFFNPHPPRLTLILILKLRKRFRTSFRVASAAARMASHENTARMALSSFGSDAEQRSMPFSEVNNLHAHELLAGIMALALKISGAL